MALTRSGPKIPAVGLFGGGRYFGLEKMLVAVSEFGSKTVDLDRASSCLGCRASAVYGLVSPESAVVADCSRGSDELI